MFSNFTDTFFVYIQLGKFRENQHKLQCRRCLAVLNKVVDVNCHVVKARNYENESSLIQIISFVENFEKKQGIKSQFSEETE